MRRSSNGFLALWGAALVALLASCSGDEGNAAAGGGGAGGAAGQVGAGAAGAAGGEVCAKNENDAIRLALAPACQGCHDAGSTRPFFASLTAFEDLLAYQPALVVRGSPESSRLIALLEGTASGNYGQMPPGTPYAKLPAAQQGASMEQIKEWIRKLPERAATAAAASPAAVTTRRLRVGELTAQLQRALGYKETGAVYEKESQPPNLWIRDPDRLGEIDNNQKPGVQTWMALGGGSSLQRLTPAQVWSPGEQRVLVQVSLAWCQDAVARGDKALFRDAAPGDTRATAAAKVRANIGYLHLRLLGEPATAQDLDAYENELFAKAEPQGAAAAWTEVCAALIRDPRFLSF